MGVFTWQPLAADVVVVYKMFKRNKSAKLNLMAGGNKGTYKGRAYQCRKCSKVDRKGRTIAHILKHHVPFDQVPYSCSLCNFRCQDKETLVKHINSYKRHKDEILKAGGKVDHSKVLNRSVNPKYNFENDLVLLNKFDSSERFGRQEDPLDDLDSIFEEDEEESNPLLLPDWAKEGISLTNTDSQVTPSKSLCPNNGVPANYVNKSVLNTPELILPVTPSVRMSTKVNLGTSANISHSNSQFNTISFDDLYGAPRTTSTLGQFRPMTTSTSTLNQSVQLYHTLFPLLELLQCKMKDCIATTEDILPG
ncbi:uncharacterized protein LOC132732260 [Ruditapes philippinarum]|uniref:uncharacterized protein LOC132732260 n=1 Tax=Ruditapes philippinarum TaxID=129788 RepID=UPI00295A96F1|nr:uncharacterized protein LOC132732260 [Ruditapes philippinarum]